MIRILLGIFLFATFFIFSQKAFAQAWYYPMDRYYERIQVKDFGTLINDEFYKGKEKLFPFNRFYGYHAGVDLEVFDSEKNDKTPVYAIYSGRIIYIGNLSGYGGIILQELDNQNATALYGHTNGTFRVFTASMYHNLSKDVFIQADNPNIVHVKKEGTTWDDFFKTLPFKLTRYCLTTGTKQTFCTNKKGALQFYLNGKREKDLLSKEIQDEDRALITYGNENEPQIENQLQQVPNP